MKVTVYSKNHCVMCDRTYKFLDAGDVSYSTINIEEDPKALDALVDMGFQSAPVVVVKFDDGSEDSWCGFRSDKIKSLVAAKQTA